MQFWQKNPTPYFMYVKGVLQYEKKDYEGAIATFNQIISEGKDFVGEAYSKIGDCSFFPAQENRGRKLQAFHGRSEVCYQRS
mgnify:CR=1 FL=1